MTGGLSSLRSLAARRVQEGAQRRRGALCRSGQASGNDTRALARLLRPERNALEQLLADAPAAAWQPETQHAEGAVDICSVFTTDRGSDPLAALEASTCAALPTPLEQLIAGARP